MLGFSVIGGIPQLGHLIRTSCHNNYEACVPSDIWHIACITIQHCDCVRDHTHNIRLLQYASRKSFRSVCISPKTVIKMVTKWYETALKNGIKTDEVTVSKWC